MRRKGTRSVRAREYSDQIRWLAKLWKRALSAECFDEDVPILNGAAQESL